MASDIHEHPEIRYIGTDKLLAETCEILSHKKEFAFDTEFDRFYREYGFKLSLLQIFDGECCYLIDPISIKDLQPLWPLFEDPEICKVVYSCSEDIQILKVNGCNPKNIYDVQIAAKLCNHPATSLSALILQEFGIPSDKTLQRSNWRRRPLSKEQLLYAGNDVSKLSELKEILERIAEKKHLGKMIVEENRACENIPVSEYTVKLSVTQKRKYDTAYQKILLALLLLRNEIAIQYNVPPANIVSDSTLENIIENKQAFLVDPFSKGFSKRFAEDKPNQKKFLTVIENINGSFTPRYIPERNREMNGYVKAEATETEFDKKYALLYDEITKQYGKESGEFILRGYKKMISSDFGKKKLKDYQQQIIDDTCKKLNLDFSK